MAIKIRKDQDQGSYTPRNTGGGGGSNTGGGGLTNLLPLLLGLFGRNPKLLLIIAVIGGIVYFAGGKGCGSLLSDGGGATDITSIFSTGASFDPKRYAATEIFEPLADNKTNPLPEKISLLKYAPKRMNQGQQGSCVAWAAAYSARSIMQSRESGANPNSTTFSPSFLYNQIALENCQGSYLAEAMKVMKGKGLAPFSEMPYTDQDCSARPNSMQLRSAEEYKIDGYQRLTGGQNGEDVNKVNMLAIKQNIAQGAPVVIGMMVGGSFMQSMAGKDMWLASESDYAMRGFGGHAMTVIGYDDYKYAQNMGGFEIMNSWGEDWGNKGVAWVSYDDFSYFVKEAYGIYPMGDAAAPATSVLDAKLGIMLNSTSANLPLQQTGENTFRTTRNMRTNEEFKLEVINNIECYVYIFAQEADGTTTTLFPYTNKHSPYCGIRGQRLFPRDYSMYPDEVGNADYFAIVVTKAPLDYDAFKTKLNSTPGSSYAEKINKLVPVSSGIKMQGGNQISLSADLNNISMAAAIVEVTK